MGADPQKRLKRPCPVKKKGEKQKGGETKRRQNQPEGEKGEKITKKMARPISFMSWYPCWTRKRKQLERHKRKGVPETNPLGVEPPTTTLSSWASAFVWEVDIWIDELECVVVPKQREHASRNRVY